MITLNNLSTSAHGSVLEQIEAQVKLFDNNLSRLELLRVRSCFENAKSLKVNVWRNHSFESVLELSQPYFAFAKLCPEFVLSDYDDALVFDNYQASQLELIWLDSDRYALATQAFDEWVEWLVTRVRSLRVLTSAPIIVATWLLDQARAESVLAKLNAMPSVYFADIGHEASKEGIRLIDKRTAAVAGTPVSNQAQVLLARKLACHWIPAATVPPIKALALDLDNTLHRGVLGEDGFEGVELTEGHRALQEHIKLLRERGVFIALVSRNERQDVEDLFDLRNDYPLKWKDFSATEISWGDKAESIHRIARTLRIAPDSILFIDDNPGEITNLAIQIPSIHLLFADDDPYRTIRALEYYPGLWRWRVESDDAKRIEDLKANAEREALMAQAIDSEEYFRSLNVSLKFRYDPLDQLGRLADLCSKTNQFNLTMRRFNQAELAEYMSREDGCVISVQMQDRISDSGVIAVIVCERVVDDLIVRELCISCRALGRRIEDTLIISAIRNAPLFHGARNIIFCTQQGPRNQPALEWISKLLGELNNLPQGQHSIGSEIIINFTPAGGVTLIME